MAQVGPATDWTAAPTDLASGSEAPPGTSSSGLVTRLIASGLDVSITLYAAGLALIAVTGGVDLGMVSFRDAGRPVLALTVLVPLRLAIGRQSWLADATLMTVRHLRVWWALVSAHTSAAVVDAVFAVVLVQAASVAAVFIANVVSEPGLVRGFTLPFSTPKFAELFIAWDSGWYWDIALRGYYFRPDGQSSVAFFPLYPMLMRAVAAPFGGGAGATWVAGIVIALIAYVLALIAIHRLTERIFHSREAARRTVLYVAVFPWSLFMVRVYTESVFLLTTVLAVSCAVRGRWWQAGVWGALATLTRPNGALIAVPLFVLAFGGKPTLREFTSRVVALAPIPAALAGFSAYVHALSGDPLSWMTAQSEWGYSVGHRPWQQLQRLINDFIANGPYDYLLLSPSASIELLHGGTALLCLALTPWIFKRLGIAMGAYVLISLLVPLSSNALEGLGRYVSVLFPAFMLVGTSVTSPRLHDAILIVSLVFQTLLTWLFVTWQPIY